MKGNELVKWIEENGMQEAEVYVNGPLGYEKVEHAWESEYAGGAVMLEVWKDDAD